MNKPECKLLGEDGNVFMVMGLVQRALKRAGQDDKAKEFTRRVAAECKTYDDVLALLQDFVEVV